MNSFTAVGLNVVRGYMKKALLLLGLVLCLRSGTLAAATCNDYPFPKVFSPAFNEYFLNDTCLTGESGVTYVSNVPSCSGTTKAWQFGFTKGTASKTFNIPSDEAWTVWSLEYKLDKVDPLHDNWTFLRARVINVTDGVILAEHNYHGVDSDVTCLTRVLSFNASLAGKQIKVEFQGRTAGWDTVVRVRRVQLFQIAY